MVIAEPIRDGRSCFLAGDEFAHLVIMHWVFLS